MFKRIAKLFLLMAVFGLSGLSLYAPGSGSYKKKSGNGKCEDCERDKKRSKQNKKSYGTNGRRDSLKPRKKSRYSNY